MSYYKQKILANNRIQSIVDAIRKSKKQRFVDEIVLEVTNIFQISEKAVEQRLELIARVDAEKNAKPMMIIREGVIKWL